MERISINEKISKKIHCRIRTAFNRNSLGNGICYCKNWTECRNEHILSYVAQISGEFCATVHIIQEKNKESFKG